MNEVIFEEREDLADDLAQAEADEQWWAAMDEDEEYIKSWEMGHLALEPWDMN